jgi:hypothetical protein
MSTPKYDRLYMGFAVSSMITALENYVRAYENHYEQEVGLDYVLGDEGVKPILHGLNTLLNGELGKFDGGTLSRRIDEIAKKAGIEL